MHRCQFLILVIMSLCWTNGLTAAEPSTEPTIVWSNPPSGALPMGVTHRTFSSAVAKVDVGYCVYLPPEYEMDTTKRYPVIYILHGNGGNETKNVSDGPLLAEGIKSGRWPAMILVFPNGGRSTMYHNSTDGRFPIETVFITELIPHIDSTFRTIAEAKGRCIEGFSMGGRGATHLAIKYPTLFCSLFCQAGNVPHILDDFDQGKLTPMLGKERANYEANDVYAMLNKNVDQIKKTMRIQVTCGKADPGHLATIRDFHAALIKLGIEHPYVEFDGLGHQKSNMIELMQPAWFDFHTESLRHFGAIK